MKSQHLAILGGLSCIALGSLLAIVSVVACQTADPRAGSAQPGTTATSANTAGSSSGGIDAASVNAALECGPAPTTTGVAFTKQALLAASADCAAWHSCNFVKSATTLRDAVRAHAAAGGDASAAKTAWRSAMDQWSRMELFQYGPVASRVTDSYHGRGLRAFVHPWPDLNRCQVETQIVSKGYQQGWDQVLPSSRGLYALEYLLHYPGSDTVCLANSTAAKTWSTTSPDQLAKDKLAYEQIVADNVLSLALEIHNVWPEAGENFKAKLVAGDGYGSDQEALNIVAWSLLYVHTELKDFKIANVAGVGDGPPNPETPFARIELENIRTNLQAFRRLFQGCADDYSGLGFDDWLDAVGANQLTRDLLAALAAAEAKAATFPAFDKASTAELLELYNAVKPLSDLLKTSFFGSASPLNLRIAPSAASDTD